VREIERDEGSQNENFCDQTNSKIIYVKKQAFFSKKEIKKQSLKIFKFAVDLFNGPNNCDLFSE
jgi:hypothetical protein